MDKKYFTNRELSWLDFNYRVLSEAKDEKTPLFERLKFLSITASNLDEFYMIRVASLKDMVNASYEKPDVSGLTPKEQLRLINEKSHEMVDRQYETYNKQLLKGLESSGLMVISKHEDLEEEDAKYVDKYFEKEVYPVLTPMAVDSSRPFPLIRNKSLNIAALLQKKNNDKEIDFATVQVPSLLKRIVEIPSNGIRKVILLEEIIERNINKLFLNYNVVCAHPYRIMRNADLTIDEDEAADLLKEIQKQLKRRQWGQAIRLEVEDTMEKRLLKILKKELAIRDDDIFKINGPLDLTVLMKMYALEGFDNLKEEKYVPKLCADINHDEDLFTQIKRRDILLFHPYESFDTVVDFVRQAAVDKDVLAIKQTLYRVSGNSPIIASLAQAAENGKQVTVLVELKARFDEENNIIWAKMLEKAGCHVIYGLVGLKTHSKITLVVRREEEGIKRYVHLATGNYNDATAKIYTDLGLLTSQDAYGEDATAVFNMLSGYSEPASWNKLSLAPIWLRDKFLYLIKRETMNAKENKPSRIIAKMNSLCDKKIIEALYEASMAGVKIDLIIRGICCLKVGIEGVSENISVRSIVGTFLEHARIFYFENAGSEEIYLGSADWMPRNLDKRVEILFPVEAEHTKKKVMHVLEVSLADNLKAHVMNDTGKYVKPTLTKEDTVVGSQMQFCKEATEAVKDTEKNVNTRVFETME